MSNFVSGEVSTAILKVAKESGRYQATVMVTLPIGKFVVNVNERDDGFAYNGKHYDVSGFAQQVKDQWYGRFGMTREVRDLVMKQYFIQKDGLVPIQIVNHKYKPFPADKQGKILGMVDVQTQYATIYGIKVGQNENGTYVLDPNFYNSESKESKSAGVELSYRFKRQLADIMTAELQVPVSTNEQESSFDHTMLETEEESVVGAL
jgi:hypothetical protein